jgi:hypothetical protein
MAVAIMATAVVGIAAVVAAAGSSPPPRNPYTVAGFARAMLALGFWIFVVMLIRSL